MAAETVRLGFIGAGGNTRLRHIPGFQAIDGIEFAAVCNRSLESGRRVAERFGIPRVESDPDAIISAPDIDAVCIGTWPYRHRDYAIAALDAGKHVLTEARMAMNAGEAAEMLEAAGRHADLVAQIVPAPMDLLVWRTVRRLIAEGTLGEIREAHVDVLNGSSLDLSAPLHWRHQLRYSGMNVMSFGIYTEIVTRWLGRTRRLVADGAVFVGERTDPEGGGQVAIEVPDSLGVLAITEGGTRVTYRVSTVTHESPPVQITLYGSRGTLNWRGEGDLVLTLVGRDPEPLSPDPGTALGWQVESDFIASIRERRPVELTNFASGLHYMQITEAVQLSLAEGRAVNPLELPQDA